MVRNSEPVVNAALAGALDRRHPRWRVTAGRSGVFGNRAPLPDIVVNQGRTAPVVIETEFAPAARLEEDARALLGMMAKERGFEVEQAVAVRLGGELRGAADIRGAVEEAAFEWCVLSGGGGGACARWPERGWLRGGASDLAMTVEHVALPERLIAEWLAALELGVRQTAGVLRGEPQAVRDRIARLLNQEAGEQTSRMAMAIIANALTFHAMLADARGMPDLDGLRGDSDGMMRARLVRCWRETLRINHWPIFRIALDLVLSIRAATAGVVLDRLAEVARELARIGATSLNDVCGRMFQRLISDRKFLATFYTLPESATLLAELAIPKLDVDWSDPGAVRGLRMGDLACGAGALLLAAYQGALARHRHAGGDDAKLHAPMMERALVAADIMPAATHLTASNLSGAHPGVTFERMSVYTMPYGAQPQEAELPVAIGALDLLDAGGGTRALFGAGQRQTRGDATDVDARLNIPHECLDLAIMNPPFTRPTNHESATAPVPSFAGFGTSGAEQAAMSARLREIGRRMKSRVGNGNAGLASHFVDLAHVKTRPGGVIALVLPASFVQGGSWAAARALVEAEYRDVVVVTIAASGNTDRAFSADTGMAEVMLAAQKRKPGDGAGRKAVFANLKRRPGSVLEAGDVARALRGLPRSGSGAEAGWIEVADGAVVGCWVRDSVTGGGAAGVSNPELAAAMLALAAGKLRPARRGDCFDVPVTRLGELGERGPIDRDIAGWSAPGVPRGPWDMVDLADAETPPTYPALWAHSAQRERRLVVEPDRAGRVREGCRAAAADRWRTAAGKLHFNRDFQINSQSLAACLTPEPAIGGRAWPSFIANRPEWEKAVVLWANTTLGLMSFWWRGVAAASGTRPHHRQPPARVADAGSARSEPWTARPGADHLRRVPPAPAPPRQRGLPRRSPHRPRPGRAVRPARPARAGSGAAAPSARSVVRGAERPRREADADKFYSKFLMSMARHSEPAVNIALADALDRRHPRWRVTAEQSDIFGNRALRPDIVVNRGKTAPIVIETEFAPAATVEEDARVRVGKLAKECGFEVEQVVAVRLGKELRGATDLRAAVEAAEIEWCVLSGDGGGSRRWPDRGWLRGGVSDLAMTIEQIALSERQIAQGLATLELGVRQTAGILCGEPRDSIDRIAELLHQEDGEQTSRTAMAIISNALQRLVPDRKFLATFYTLPNSSTLLAELAIPELDVDWSDAAAVRELRIGDLACGAGALLLAAYQGALARHRHAGGDDAKLHAPMMERALVAADIMPAATHLTASNLSGAHPGVTFKRTSVYTMPYGRQPQEAELPVAIGSLDLLDEGRDTRALFGTGQRQPRGDSADATDVDVRVDIPHECLDLAIMNPPFTRPTNHELAAVPVPSFAGFGTSDDEQAAMSARLREIGRRTKPRAGNGNAGLASNFVDLAHVKTRPGGVIALVLPAAFAQGGSWAAARKLVKAEYKDVVVVTIAAAGGTRQAFSADTGMAEVLLVAKKRKPGEAPDRTAVFANLNRRPRSLLEASRVARTIRQQSRNGPDAGWLQVADGCGVGSYVRDALADSGAAGVSNPDLAATMLALAAGKLRLRRQGDAIEVPVALLGELGERGPIDRDIVGRTPQGSPRGPWDMVDLADAETPPTYPALWAHSARRERCMVVEPDRAGRVREGCRKAAADRWRTAASRLHFNRDFRLNSQSLAACLTSEPAIGGRAWPSFIPRRADWEEAMALWANTTLGLMSFWWKGSRQQQGRASMTVSILPEMPVMDTRTLGESRLDKAKRIFAKFRERPLLPANEAYRDEVRADLDRAVLCGLLDLPEQILEPLRLLRDQWCAEPSVHGGKATRPR